MEHTYVAHLRYGKTDLDHETVEKLVGVDALSVEIESVDELTDEEVKDVVQWSGKVEERVGELVEETPYSFGSDDFHVSSVSNPDE